MRGYHRKLVSLLLITLLLPFSAFADDLIMRRIGMTFPETMNALQTAIVEEGFKVSRVQRVDIGLTSSGYNTAEYRIVFFMSEDVVHDIVKQHPELIAFLPLKITIFAEGSETILVSLNPLKLAEFFPDLKMDKTFAFWNDKVIRILDRVQSE
ncbi:MAG: DUF302 domain-containing protein [Pseudomonadota bacterium]|nr:DUF302 domain-containing protein [Pseudomonadota bacterium]